jgi:hypothetical protein
VVSSEMQQVYQNILFLSNSFVGRTSLYVKSTMVKSCCIATHHVVKCDKHQYYYGKIFLVLHCINQARFL